MPAAASDKGSALQVALKRVASWAGGSGPPCLSPTCAIPSLLARWRTCAVAALERAEQGKDKRRH